MSFIPVTTNKTSPRALFQMTTRPQRSHGIECVMYNWEQFQAQPYDLRADLGVTYVDDAPRYVMFLTRKHSSKRVFKSQYRRPTKKSKEDNLPILAVVVVVEGRGTVTALCVANALLAMKRIQSHVSLPPHQDERMRNERARDYSE